VLSAVTYHALYEFLSGKWLGGDVFGKDGRQAHPNLAQRKGRSGGAVKPIQSNVLAIEGATVLRHRKYCHSNVLAVK
jgi:hypothetical protein